jgi:hypothetical protein
MALPEKRPPKSITFRGSGLPFKFASNPSDALALLCARSGRARRRKPRWRSARTMSVEESFMLSVSRGGVGYGGNQSGVESKKA